MSVARNLMSVYLTGSPNCLSGRSSDILIEIILIEKCGMLYLITLDETLLGELWVGELPIWKVDF